MSKILLTLTKIEFSQLNLTNKNHENYLNC